MALFGLKDKDYHKEFDAYIDLRDAAEKLIIAASQESYSSPTKKIAALDKASSAIGREEAYKKSATQKLKIRSALFGDFIENRRIEIGKPSLLSELEEALTEDDEETKGDSNLPSAQD